MLETMNTDALTWLGILFCVTQSGMFSGLNLALLGLSRLHLEVEVAQDNAAAKKILVLRHDSNFLLTTILWGNVSINVILTLLSDSVLAGVSAFLFSTVVITFFGEIMPQAYFSRNALRMGSLLAPVLRLYQFILYPVAKPSAKLLDWWLGKEGIVFIRERDLRTVIKKHIATNESDIDRLEGIGALNFLELDDLIVSEEGEHIDPKSIITLPCLNGEPVFPLFTRSATDPFIQSVNASGKKWVIIVDEKQEPHLVLNANAFLRDALLKTGVPVRPQAYAHRPILATDSHMLLGDIILRLEVYAQNAADDVIDQDLILLWGHEQRVITGSDILGRLLRGIVVTNPQDPKPVPKPAKG
jgi:hypothetical protein